jgi:peptidoglycan/LPS O-acetylase OafA/YrhL
LHADRDGLRGLGRLSADRWLGAALGIAATTQLAGIQMNRGHPHFAAAHAACVGGYALMMWSLVSLTLGLFQRCCARPRAWVRYVADASYWLYLVHLPVVVWLQVAVAETAYPWWAKLAVIVTVTVAGGLLSYDLFVRDTWIGWVLNGRRGPSVVVAWASRTVRGRTTAIAPAARCKAT